MRELLAGIVVIVVLGFGAFLYRNTMERPWERAPLPACPQDALLCPDGSTVGREGPACTFAACPVPVATTTLDSATSSKPEPSPTTTQQ